MSAREPAVGRDLVWVVLAYAVAGVSGLATQIVIARTLGVATFGVYVSSLALVYLFRIVTRFGGTQYIIREGARDRAHLDMHVRMLARLTALGTGALALIAAGVAAALGFGRTGVIVALLLALMTGADCVTDAYRSALTATRHIGAAAAISAGVAGLSGLGMIVAIVSGSSIVGATAVSMVVSIGAIPVAAMLARVIAGVRVGSGSAHDAPFAQLVGPFMRQVRPFALTALFALGAAYVDSIIIRVALGAEAAGHYGAPYRIFTAIAWIAHAYASVLLPRWSRTFARSPAAYVMATRYATARTFLCALPVAALGAIYAEPAITAAFGPAFHAAGAPMRILFLALPVSLASIVIRQALLAGDRAHEAAWILACALALNVALNAVAIPTWGIAGAASVTLATDSFILTAALRVLARVARTASAVHAAPAYP